LHAVKKLFDTVYSIRSSFLW